jgi:hypothetical protein
MRIVLLMFRIFSITCNTIFTRCHCCCCWRHSSKLEKWKKNENDWKIIFLFNWNF